MTTADAARGTVFLVDDDPVFRESLEQSFELADLPVQSYAQPLSVLGNITEDTVGVVVSDVRMPKLSGEQLLVRLKELDADLPVILLTGHGDVPMAVRSLQSGAFAFHEKPVDAKTLVQDCRRALELRAAVVSKRQLSRQLQGRNRLFRQVLGSSPKIQALRQQLSTLGGTDTDVLFVGETGAGKEVAARALHSISARSMQPFVPINCAALDGADINQQLFGIEDATGLGAAAVGLFERADKGTLFLDEVESMPLDTQARLLRILEERRLKRVGGQGYVALNLRVMAAAKTDLAEAMQAGRFRDDLYYRLNAARVLVPPMRERGADCVVLFEHFLNDDEAAGVLANGSETGGSETGGRANGAEPKPARRQLAPEDMTRILRHAWPGNAREVRNAAHRYLAGLDWMDEPAATTPTAEDGRDLATQVADFERGVLEKELHLAAGNLKRVMERLGLPRKTLADKLAKYGLKR